MAEYAVVGRPIPKVDAVDKVTGSQRYPVDVTLPGMLWARILRSSYSHARIRSIDTNAAERMPGVVAVLTARDLPGKRIGNVIKDHEVLASTKVRYQGEPVAAVAAVSEAVADAACAAIDVGYEELPAVYEVEEALEPTAALVHEELGTYEIRSVSSVATTPFVRPVPGTNICHAFRLRCGSVPEGLRDSTLVSEDEFSFQMVHHAPMEPQSCLAEVSDAGNITVWSSVQNVHRVRQWLGEYLDIPQSKIRVIGLNLGGSFGLRATLTIEPILVCLARRTRRPVKLVMTRSENFIAAGGRRPGRMRIKSGVDAGGRILARQIRVLWNAGAVCGTGSISVNLSSLVAPGPYRIPNVEVDAQLVYTNRVGAEPFRGLGAPQVTWAAESHMDLLARKLGIDPLDFRLRNAFEDGDRAPWGERLKGVSVKEALRRAAAAVGWSERNTIAEEGYGMAAVMKWTIPGTLSHASVKVHEDGTVAVMSGISDIGTGAATVMAQIAAEELGVDIDSVRVWMADTELTPYDYGASSSRGTVHAGNAVREAALSARRQVIELAGRMLGLAPEGITLREGYISRIDRPDERIPLNRFLKGYVTGVGAFQGGGYGYFDPDTGESERPTHEWKYGSTAAKVSVDRQTGSVTVRRLVGVHDIGFAINPLNVETQIQGSLVMGLGATLLEEMVFDGGRVANPNFMEYLLPTASEIPDELLPVLLETRTGEGPYGAKGIGEPGIVGVSAAIGNAVEDAVGVRIRDLPITAERVARALNDIED